MSDTLPSPSATISQPHMLAGQKRDTTYLSYGQMTPDEKNEAFNRDLTYGLEQTAMCFATDFIDPEFGRMYQNKFGIPEYNIGREEVWGGEIVGDLMGLVGYLATKRMFRKPLAHMTDQVEQVFDPFIDKAGRRTINKWASEQGVSEQDPEYQEKLTAYKKFQANTIMDTTMVGAYATAANIVAQRYMFGNKNPWSVISVGKLGGAAITMGAMFATRTILPDTTHSLDKELNHRYISPIVGFARRLAGIKPVKHEPQLRGISTLDDVPEENPDERITGFKRKKLTHMVAQHLNEISAFEANEAKQWQIEQQILSAMAEVLTPASEFAHEFSAQHHQMMRLIYAKPAEQLAYGKAMLDEDVSRKSVESILNNRQLDLEALANEMELPNIRHEIEALRKGSSQLSQKLTFPPAKQESLIRSLLQPNEHANGEPAVHIYANAKGQIIEHEALAHCFNPEGVLAKKFAELLTQKLPDLDADFVTHIAKNYLADRQQAALQTAEILTLDGPLVAQAVARSEKLQSRYAAASAHAAPGV